MDKAITSRSGILDLLEPGDSVWPVLDLEGVQEPFGSHLLMKSPLRQYKLLCLCCITNWEGLPNLLS